MINELDKQLHILAGSTISLFVTIAMLSTSFVPYAPIVGLLLALVAGILKEVYDLYVKKTEFDKRDVLATVMGGSLSLLTYLF